MTSRVLRRCLAATIAFCTCMASAADAELQWTGSAGNGNIDDKDNWGGTTAPINGYYGNFRSLTGRDINVGASADAEINRIYFQSTQNATFNFDFTDHTVSFTGSGGYPLQTHSSCSGNTYNFLGGTFAFGGTRTLIDFSYGSSTVNVGSRAIFTGTPEFQVAPTSGSSTFTIQAGYSGNAFVKANGDAHVIIEGVDRSTCITNNKESAWTLSGDLDFGSARLERYGLWTGYESYGHSQNISNALIDVQGILGHGYAGTASNNVLRIFGGTEIVLPQPNNNDKCAYAAGYLGCSNTVEISGASTRMTVSGTDWSLSGLACGMMGDRNLLHITDGAEVDIGGTSLMIGIPKYAMNRGRSVGNRIQVDGGARVVSGPIWIGCSGNRTDRNYNGTNSSHTYNRDASGALTTDVDMTISLSSNVVVFAGQATTGVVNNVYVSADDDYRAELPTLTDANGFEVRDGAVVNVSGNVVVGSHGVGNYLAVANGGYLAANTLNFGSDSVLEFGVDDAMSASDAMIQTYTASYNLTFSGAPDVVIDTTGLTAGREQTLVAAQPGKSIVLDEGALATMNANLKVKGNGSAELLLMDNSSRLVARLSGVNSGLSIFVR